MSSFPVSAVFPFTLDKVGLDGTFWMDFGFAHRLDLPGYPSIPSPIIFPRLRLPDVDPSTRAMSSVVGSVTGVVLM